MRQKDLAQVVIHPANLIEAICTIGRQRLSPNTEHGHRSVVVVLPRPAGGDVGINDDEAHG